MDKGTQRVPFAFVVEINRPTKEMPVAGVFYAESFNAVSAYTVAAAQGLDFFALTPHNHLIDNDEYGAVLDAATGAGGVVGLFGQEWSSIESGNHTIVLGVVQRVTVPLSVLVL